MPRRELFYSSPSAPWAKPWAAVAEVDKQCSRLVASTAVVLQCQTGGHAERDCRLSLAEPSWSDLAALAAPAIDSAGSTCWAYTWWAYPRPTPPHCATAAAQGHGIAV